MQPPTTRQGYTSPGCCEGKQHLGEIVPDRTSKVELHLIWTRPSKLVVSGRGHARRLLHLFVTRTFAHQCHHPLVRLTMDVGQGYLP